MGVGFWRVTVWGRAGGWSSGMHGWVSYAPARSSIPTPSKEIHFSPDCDGGDFVEHADPTGTIFPIAYALATPSPVLTYAIPTTQAVQTTRSSPLPAYALAIRCPALMRSLVVLGRGGGNADGLL
eukprot:3230375-Rhodomonas_salina.1